MKHCICSRLKGATAASPAVPSEQLLAGAAGQLRGRVLRAVAAAVRAAPKSRGRLAAQGYAAAACIQSRSWAMHMKHAA